MTFDKEQIFLFPGETLTDIIFDKGIRFDIVKKEESIWCGALGYAADLTAEPDIEGLLARYQALISAEKRELVSPDWSGCLSIGYWPGGDVPRGIMFMQQVAAEEQDKRYDLYKTPASLYIRVHYDSAEIPEKLLRKEQCGVFELYGPIHELAEKNGYEALSPVSYEFEYYGSKSCYAYCAVKKKTA